MLIARSLAELPEQFGPSVVTIGKFDGVHVGHRAVLQRLVAIARERSLVATVVTFDRHPADQLRPGSSPPELLSGAQKLERLAGADIDAVLVLPFDAELSRLAPDQFVSDILVAALQARVILVGRDFRFGMNGSGTVQSLRRMGAASGFEVQVIDDVMPTGDRRVSSTWIRELLAAGEVGRASELLGRNPAVRAEVVRGEQRGRTLGYPTANLSPEVEGFIPADGVYAAWLEADGRRYPAAVSIGNNPTFDSVPEKQVEAHALDADLHLYGSTVTVSFVRFIRGMRKFPDVDALIAQMNADEVVIRGVLNAPARVTTPGAPGAREPRPR